MDTDRIVAEAFIRKYPLRAAHVLERLKDVEVAAYIQKLPIDLVVPTLNLMDLHKVATCFPFLSPELMKSLMENSDFSLTESLVRQLDEPFRNQMLDTLSPGFSFELRKKLEQDVDSVGALMVPIRTPLYMEMTVKEVREIVKKNKHIPITYLFVIDMLGKFEGVIPLHKLFLTDGSDSISSLTDREIPRFFPDMPVAGIIGHPAWYEYRIIPVVDSSGKLMGALPFEMTRKGTSTKKGERTQQILETGNALGELYRVGLTGFLRSFE
ncbi:MAG: hypothetical protein WBG90_02980 [Saonia sp.]